MWYEAVLNPSLDMQIRADKLVSSPRSKSLRGPARFIGPELGFNRVPDDIVKVGYFRCNRLAILAKICLGAGGERCLE